MKLREYQQRVIDSLYFWWVAHPGVNEIPLLVLPTGAGKSVVIAELTRLLFDTWPDLHPRTVVLVPSKELAEQNGEKLAAMLPSHIRLGYYSASLGKKMPNADVIVATIGSIYKDAHLLGNINCVIVDEAHLISPDGKEKGRYRQFISSLSKICQFRVVGFTATPYRGNGVWLTDGDDPLFTGIAATVTMAELMEQGFLAPLVRPMDVIKTHISTDGISTANGDYNIGELSNRVDEYLPGVADEAIKLAAERKKWIAFTATVENAKHLVDLLLERGICAALVCGSTAKAEREILITRFRHGELRCLVTVLALAIGFDVPDVDCIIWCRPTQSPVLYVQGAGRGLRIAPGKENCLWLDFSDTTERLGPVDTIKGRKKRNTVDDPQAPYAICPECGERVIPASLMNCPACGAQMREPKAAEAVPASDAAVMSFQQQPKLSTYTVTDVRYSIHKKEGKPDSLRVDYYAGLSRVASEYVCVGHSGFARAKAEAWWEKRFFHRFAPLNASDAEFMTRREDIDFIEPSTITVNETSKYPEIVGYTWPQLEQAA